MSRVRQELGNYQRRLKRVRPSGTNAAAVQAILTARLLATMDIREELDKVQRPSCPPAPDG